MFPSAPVGISGFFIRVELNEFNHLDNDILDRMVTRVEVFTNTCGFPGWWGGSIGGTMVDVSKVTLESVHQSQFGFPYILYSALVTSDDVHQIVESAGDPLGCGVFILGSMTFDFTTCV